MKKEPRSMDSEPQEVSLDKWGIQLMENLLLMAAENVAERTEKSNSVEVTLKFLLTPISSKDQLEVKVAFDRDPLLITYIPRRLS